jgi:hypothetical protein
VRQWTSFLSLRTDVGIRDGVVQLVSTLGSAVISARAELGSIIASALPVAAVLTGVGACGGPMGSAARCGRAWRRWSGSGTVHPHPFNVSRPFHECNSSTFCLFERQFLSGALDRERELRAGAGGRDADVGACPIEIPVEF